jgi:hypothetical protein
VLKFAGNRKINQILKRSHQIQNLVVKFTDELERTLQELTNEEKADVLKTLLDIVSMYEAKVEYSEVWQVAEEKLLIRYKHKLKAFFDSLVLDYFHQKSMKLLELQDEAGITTDEQFMTDAEYPAYLTDLKRMLQLKRQFAILTELNIEKEPKEAFFDDIQGKNPEHTTRRQALTIYYLSQHCGFNSGTEIALARFVQFLTGKSLDNITKILRNPLKIAPEKRKRADEELIKDLIYIREYFDSLKLPQIANLINRDITEVTKG